MRDTPGGGMFGLALLNLIILSHMPKIRLYGMLLKVYVINNPYALSHIFLEHSQHLMNPGYYYHDDDVTLCSRIENRQNERLQNTEP